MTHLHHGFNLSNCFEILSAQSVHKYSDPDKLRNDVQCDPKIQKKEIEIQQSEK